MPVLRRTPSRPAPENSAQLLVGSVVALALLTAHPGAQASALSDSLAQLTQGQRFERRISLSTMGLLGSSINVPAGSMQEFYFPVHAGDGSRSLLVTTPANQPTASFAVNGVQASASTAASSGNTRQMNNRLPITAAQGQARLGMQAGAMPKDGCDSAPAGGVALDPGSYLSYYPSAADTAAPAWTQGASTLPDRPFLLVAAPPLNSETFDTAWRVGIVMARQGRPATVHTLPAVGDVVDTRTLAIPQGLAAIPAFAALADGSAHHTIANAAEVGALLMLDAADVLADVVVVDSALRTQIGSALDALAAQITDDDTLRLLAQWRERQMPLAGKDVSVAPFSRMPLGAHPVWAVPASGAASLAAISDNAGWLRLSATANGAARTAANQADHALVRASDDPARGQYLVQAPQSWSATFAMLPPATSSHTPAHVQIGFTLPAKAASQKPVGVLRWNGILLAARQLQGADGQRQTLEADIPVYALSALNLLQVALEQDAPAGGCGKAAAVPATALDFNVRFSSAAPAGLPRNPAFSDLIPRLGFDAEMAVPEGFLSQAREGLSAAIHLASAANLSPSAARLVLVEQGKPYTPTRPFVAAGVALRDATSPVSLKGGEIRFHDRPVQGLPWPARQSAMVSVMQVAQASGQAGLLWYPLGDNAWPEATGLLVNRAPLALLGPGADVAWVDGSGNVALASEASDAGPMYEWRSLFSWGVPVTLGLLILFVALLIASMIATRAAKRRKPGPSGGTS
ncbi:hypothetical protein [Diaphorobacter ruginosibacter]|uniref:hypothetical protein n=1 Tax=Diaphorobacter ruginosibacter TaxID=1715720 RepID=UPI003340E22F